MPLTSRKLAHITAKTQALHQGRAQQIILTLRASDGTTTTTIVPAIWRVQGDYDPTLEGPTNQRTHLGADPDINAVFLQSDISLSTLRSVIYAQPVDEGGGQPGLHYTLLDVEPIGIPPGGDRIFTKWTKQR